MADGRHSMQFSLAKMILLIKFSDYNIKNQIHKALSMITKNVNCQFVGKLPIKHGLAPIEGFCQLPADEAKQPYNHAVWLNRKL